MLSADQSIFRATQLLLRLTEFLTMHSNSIRPVDFLGVHHQANPHLNNAVFQVNHIPDRSYYLQFIEVVLNADSAQEQSKEMVCKSAFL
ncbi:hypothetical protein Nepgr_021839 [Nepenthes gracilis]|uniref:Uncharacterized protein n=1 Tax=Nepenthes gracilis TaxID=150966 RepID=A0AAD3SXI4_NEPGR|nr:hypothetical protein Nepgr_021839 [Nepenthes gracilis]